jgi:MoaA/NifB/PqqE/SkfB family radical SAM enzyme
MLPIYLVFGVTYRCNAKCRTCFNWQHLNNSGETSKELTLDEIEAIAKSMGKLVWLLFTGGEPYLRRDLDKIAEIFYTRNKVKNITIPTNALLTEPIIETTSKILEACPKAKVVVSLALDDIGEKHDIIRGVPGNFTALLKTYAELAKLRNAYKNLSVNLNTVITNQNVGRIETIIDYVKTNMPDVDFHGFELIRGEPKDSGLVPPSIEEYQAALVHIKKYWKSYKFYNMPLSKLLKGAKILARDIELQTIREQRQVIPCYAGSISGVIDPDGNVRLCELLPAVGNLYDAGLDFSKVWFSGEADKYRRAIGRKECFCTHSCFISSSLLFNPMIYPKLFGYMARYY